MAWPTIVISTTDMDAAGDNPGNARAAIKQMADNVNYIKDSKGAASGIAELDTGGKVPVAQVPTVPANQGGTGKTVYAVGDLLVADTTTTLKRLAAGTSGDVLTSNGAGAEPTYQTVTAPIASKAEAEAGVNNTKMMTALRVSESINAKVSLGLSFNLITTSGSFTVPNGVYNIIVIAFGASGGGGGAQSYTGSKGGIGGNGGEAFASVGVTPGSTINVTIGSAGSAGSAGGGTGGSGTTTSFGSLVTITGGTGGSGGGVGTTGAAGTNGVASSSGLLDTQYIIKIRSVFGGNGAQVTSAAGSPGSNGLMMLLF